MKFPEPVALLPEPLGTLHTAIRLGGLTGNAWRLTLSAVVLGTLVLLLYPGSLAWPTAAWFFVSGLIGFGVGDVGLFLAYERIGSRLAVLLNLCLAPMFAAVAEWIWLGNGLSGSEAGAAGVILSGVALALWPARERVRPAELQGSFAGGVLAAIVAGFGQGTGAVISRKANAVEDALGLEINGLSEAGQRVIAGVLVAWVTAWVWNRWRPARLPADLSGARNRTATLGWLTMAALCGPVIGVSCFQQALAVMANSGLVLAVVAVTPIVLMPMAWLTEKDRPTALSVAGGVLAVAGVILIYRLRS